MKNIRCNTIAHVVVKQPNNDYELISVRQFVEKGALERHRLIKEKLIEFVDYEGNTILLLPALQALTEFMRALREDGGLYSTLVGSN